MGAPKILDIDSQFLLEPSALADASTGIGLVENLDSKKLVELALHHGFQHIIQKDGPHFDQEIKAARTMIDKPAKFFANPLAVICGNSETLKSRRYSSEYSTGIPKAQALADFTYFLEEASGTRRVSDIALLAVDEFYTNASRNGWEKKPFASDQILDPAENPVERPGKIEIFAHADSQRLVLGCRDTYGSLELTTILKRLETCMVNGVSESIRRGPGGAGLGSYLVFQSGLSYYAGVHRNQTTVVCVALALGQKAKAESDPAKNLHLVSL